MPTRTAARLATRTAVAASLALAVLGAHAASVTHNYQLNGSLNDALGGPALGDYGGVVGASSYAFGPGQGLSLSGGIANTADYSIEMQFSFDSISSYRRILEFKNGTSDAGLYNLNSALNFYNIVTGSGGAFAAGDSVNIVVTRDAATRTFVGYVDGVLALSFTDAFDLAVFSGPNGIANFFRDDNVTGGENSAGRVDFIRVFDGAMTGTQALCLQTNSTAACGLGDDRGGAVPEPAPVALLGAAALALAASRRNKRRA